VDGLTWMDATDQAALVRTGVATPLELVDAALERLERVNPTINAVIHLRAERARGEAAGPLPDGPFRGVPVLLKDLGAPSAGDPYHCGAAFLAHAGYRADHDGALVRRLRQAGFVVIGRTNVPEFGSTITTEPLAYGPTRNPWDTGYSAGGSSGGSAAAVAAGIVAVAHGNDGGGSIRIPASECGLVGLKPTRARVSQAPDVGQSWDGGTIDGVLSRTVRDTAAVLDQMAGPETGDPYPAPPLVRPLLDEVGRDPGRLRVGVLDRPPAAGPAADPDAAAAVAVAAAALAGLGHRVETAHPEALGDEAFPGHFINVVAAAGAADLQRWSATLGRPIADDEIEAGNAMFAAIGRRLGAADYLVSLEWLDRFRRRMAAWWAGGFDLLVTPVLNGPPPPLGWLSDPVEGTNRVVGLLQYTAQFNMTGQPAISLPLSWTAGGLPVGVQVVAAFGREDLLIRVAAQLEQACPWADRHPPVHA